MTKTNAERQREFRERRKAEGYRRLTVMLDPGTVQAIEDCMDMIATPDKKATASREQIVRAAIITYRNALLANK